MAVPTFLIIATDVPTTIDVKFEFMPTFGQFYPHLVVPILLEHRHEDFPIVKTASKQDEWLPLALPRISLGIFIDVIESHWPLESRHHLLFFHITKEQLRVSKDLKFASNVLTLNINATSDGPHMAFFAP